MNKRKKVVVIALIIFSSFLTSLFFQNCAPIKSQADLPSSDSGNNTPSSTPNPGATMGCVGNPPAPVVTTVAACPAGQSGQGTLRTVTYACVGTTYQPQPATTQTFCTSTTTTAPPLTPQEVGSICDNFIVGTTPTIDNSISTITMDSGLGDGNQNTGNGDAGTASINATVTPNMTNPNGSQGIAGPNFPGISGARSDTKLDCQYTTQVSCDVIAAGSTVTKAINKDINSNYYGLNEIDEINKVTDGTRDAKFLTLINRIFSTARTTNQSCTFNLSNVLTGSRTQAYTLNHIRDENGHLCVQATLRVRMSAINTTPNGSSSNRSAYSYFDVVVNDHCWDEDRLTPTGGTLPTTANYGAVVAASSNWVVVLSQSDNDAGKSQIGSISVFDKNNFALAPYKFSLNGLVGGGSTGDGTFSASISGDSIAVGAFNRSTYKGQVQYFVRSGSTWVQRGPTLTSGLATDKASFGYSVALSSTGILAVGAPRYTNTPSAGTGDLSGHVFLFSCNASSGCDQAGMKEISSTAVGSYFGASVSISGNRLAVGAPYVTAQSDSHGDGYVRVFDISGTLTATQVGQTILPPGDTSVSTGPSDIQISNPVETGGVKAGRGFGSSVAVLGTKLIVGAPNKSKLNAGVLIAKVGEAYYYPNFTTYVNSTSASPAGVTILNNNGAQQDSRYGQGVALNNNGAFTGCPYCQANKGQVYYYMYGSGGGISTLTRTVFPLDRTNRDGFGNAIFANDTDVIVGASNRTLGSSTQAGAAYRFTAPLAGRDY